MPQASELAARLAACQEISQPWPHCILDDFLPAPVFAELVSSLPDWKGPRRTRVMPQSTLDLLASSELGAAIRRRFGFMGGTASIELVMRTTRIEKHSDRQDKLWSGILYIAGAEAGTELYDAAGNLATTVAFVPNRLLCWGHRGEMHAVPASKGRFAVQFWILR